MLVAGNGDANVDPPAPAAGRRSAARHRLRPGATTSGARARTARTERIGLLLVTGRNDDIDKIVGLESGADDYVTNALNARELLARVRSCCAACG